MHAFRPLARTALIAVAAALAAAALPAAASAGTYDVTSCSTNAQQNPPPPVSGADDAWTTETNDPTRYEFVRHCPPATTVDNDPFPGSGADLDGLVVEDRLHGGDAALGTYGQWRFDAPAGTTVTRLRLWREI